MRPALHSPLMSVTNAISGMTAVGGILLLPGTAARPRGASQLLAVGLLAPQREHPLFVGAEIPIGTVGQLPEGRAIAGDGSLNFLPVGMIIATQMQRFVNHRDIARIVDEPAIGVDLGVDADPEIDIGLQLRGPWKQLPSRARQGAKARSACRCS